MIYHFIVNEKSRTGKGQQLWSKIERELLEREIEYQIHKTEYEGHAIQIADEITKGITTNCGIVVVGGDGTINEVINGICDFSKVHFGYIPTGSANDFGRGLGLSKDPIVNLNRILNCKKVTPMDLGSVSWGKSNVKRYYAISSGVGIDAEVCKMALTSKLKTFLNKIGLGKFTYLILTIKALCSMPYETATVTYDGTVCTYERMIFTVAMNHPFEGGGVPMVPKANAFDGKISLCCIHGFSVRKAFMVLPFLVLGKHEGRKGFDIVECEEVTIDLAKKMTLHSDGEYCGERKTMHFKCEKGLLNLMI